VADGRPHPMDDGFACGNLPKSCPLGHVKLAADDGLARLPWVQSRRVRVLPADR
jgi:hypothetical protein